MRTAILLALVLAACDPKVGAGATPAQAAAPTGPLSAEGETCGATAQCLQPLRCVDAACRPPTSSRVADFHWAAGRRALDAGNADTASQSLGRALSQYETDQLVPPAALLCDYGAALRRKKGDAKAGEQAARFLHRCVLSAPPGSAQYRSAMAELAALEDMGLEPALLARGETADAYLTRPAAKPSAPPVLSVEQTVPARDKGYAAFAAMLKDKGGALLAKCAEGGTMSVPLSLKYRQTLGDDDIVVGARLDVTTTATGGAAECVRAAATGLAADFAKDLRASSGSWQGDVTVKLSSP